MHHDLIIIGAGPAGLSLARALRPNGLRIALIEQAPRIALETPAFDGREIALTQRSAQHLRRLDIWPRLSREHIAPLRDALVLNGGGGPGQQSMTIDHALGNKPELGFLVANHRIRQAAYQAAMAPTDAHGAPPDLHCDSKVVQVQTDRQGAAIELANGDTLSANLVVAADSRHSTTRRAMGIPANLHDYGRTMLVCNMTHEQPHHQTAWEWFDHGQTLALLPMNPCPTTGLSRSSVVLTLPHHELQPMMELAENAFNAAITQRFGHQLGAMQLASTRHAYPLVGVWAQRFVAQRFAVVGDAAVGMHPVTAHGFNLGLSSVETLAQQITIAHQRGHDIAAPELLNRYQTQHRFTCRGLYMATHALATLYTREDRPARWLRRAMLGAGERFTPFKRAVAASLTGLH